MVDYRRWIDGNVSHYFVVEIDGLLMAKFQECSGLSMTNEPDVIKEGGMNSSLHRFVKRTDYGDITLKRGVINIPEMYMWMQYSTLNSWSPRKDGIIKMIGDNEEVLWQWYFFKALPVKWEGPTLSGKTAAIAIESLTLAVEWIALEPPPPPPEPPEEPPPEKTPPVTLGGANFDFDKSKIRPGADTNNLNAFAAAVKDKDTTIEIHGHTDAVGKASYNKKLSLQRAESTKQHLIGQGVAAHRIKTFGHGEEQLLIPTQSACEANRRVEVFEVP